MFNQTNDSNCAYWRLAVRCNTKTMFIHSEKLNPCKCGSENKPDLDSDDFVPCWGVRCHDCKQFQHSSDWSKTGAVNTWNKENPITKDC